MKQYIDKQDKNLAKCSSQSINYKYSTLKLGENKSLPEKHAHVGTKLCVKNTAIRNTY